MRVPAGVREKQSPDEQGIAWVRRYVAYPKTWLLSGDKATARLLSL